VEEGAGAAEDVARDVDMLLADVLASEEQVPSSGGVKLAPSVRLAPSVSLAQSVSMAPNVSLALSVNLARLTCFSPRRRVPDAQEP
jgi:hypothetical protein